MIELTWLEERPIVVAIAGSNGSGKTTFYHAHLRDCGLRYVNADRLAEQLELDAYTAAGVADAIRKGLVTRGESFVFETVFSDPSGDKLRFLADTVSAGYTVVVCFIGIANSDTSAQRVAMRVSQGGHDVPDEKLHARFERTLLNLRRAIRELPHVLVFDNQDLAHPYRLVAAFDSGRRVTSTDPLPTWLEGALR